MAWIFFLYQSEVVCHTWEKVLSLTIAGFSSCLSPVVLSRQLQLLSLEHLGDVQVEEVAVEDGLDAAGDDGDDVVEAWKTIEMIPFVQLSK